MADRSVEAPRAARPQDIRNIALVGPSGAGKTTLVEAILHAAGRIDRPGTVEAGTTASDRDPVEQRQGRSVHLTVNPVVVDGVKVNLLDTPGYADYLGPLRAGLRGADAALFVVSAADGVDGRTRLLWRECAALGMPRAVAVTKIDHPRADHDAVVAQCQEAFGHGVHPAYVPAVEGEGEIRRVTGVWGLISERFYDYSEASEPGSPPKQREAPDRLRAAAGRLREELVEEVITESEDEGLMERYAEGGSLDTDLLIADLKKAVAEGGFHPVLALSPTTGVGVHELLRELPLACPDPTRRPLPEVVRPGGRPVEGLTCDPEGPLVAEVLSTTGDPYVGRVSLVRVFSGTLSPESTVHVAGEDHGTDERAGRITVPTGRDAEPVGQVVAGDLCLVAKVPAARTGDTLSEPEDPLRAVPWAAPQPVYAMAVRATHAGEEDKLARAVTRLAAEDPSLSVEVEPETHRIVLWTLGEAHLDSALDRLDHHFGVHVDTADPHVPLRETFTVPAQGLGRNVKQSGGHGEFGVCRIEVEPLESGAGLQFVDRVVGGVVPRQYVPAVEKGVRAQMEEGFGSGHPVVDLRVTLHDGKAHSVDSSDMAFQKAGRLALRDAAEEGRLRTLEPVDELAVEVDDEHLGAVMSDLSARRGRVVGTEGSGGGRVVVRAEVPRLETLRYAVDLRSIAHGSGTFTRAYVRHEP
ncbi:elongation factor G-like protein EF-G2, partial [Nocardiopsis salina]|uniref:elongation factor G-like protein EF-G2 n=1 Tax=Nocardiopsis salina TaxID=245836 RepID=UPI00036B1457